MKTFLAPSSVVLAILWLMNSIASAADPAAILQKATNLHAQGNVREAADLLKPLLEQDLAGGALTAKALTKALESLNQLGEPNEAEVIIEAAVVKHGGHWEVLEAAGNAFLNNLPHYGAIVDGNFERGGRGGRGQWANATRRDRVRGLQLLVAARDKLPAEASLSDKSRLLQRLAIAWRGNGEAWRLQALTDLQGLPDAVSGYEDERDARGYPVDVEGQPVFFAVPANYEVAKNDGERLRLAFQEWSAVSESDAATARYFWASWCRTGWAWRH